MRVLRILTRTNLGGPARQMRALAPEFARLGVSQTIVVGSLAPGETALPLPAVEGSESVPVAELVRGFSPRSDRAALRALVRIAKECSPDVVHAHTAKAGALAVRLGHLTNLPVVHTYHGHVLRDYFSWPISRAFALVEKRLNRRRAAITCVSRSCGEELQALGVLDPEAWTVVEPAVLVRASGTRECLRERLGIGDQRAIAWCGRFENVKDPELFVHTALRLQAAGARLHAFGTGSRLAHCQDVADRLGASIVWHGADERFPEWIHAFDAFVSTSRREGYPVAAIEAHLAGVPVVAPRVPGFVDLEEDACGDGVRLVTREVDALACAALEAVPPTSGAMQAANARHAPARIAAAYVSLYERVATNPRRA
ncbi:MAG: glycosyltransferase family 4 protein [Planctomycetes bacterium]|nr:glycosyltransferase family 4 protein [Planctomycetota bacterium]MCB9919218.1 glycosyltransferase family 4 protein [Planctomycetota bacterium]